MSSEMISCLTNHCSTSIIYHIRTCNTTLFIRSFSLELISTIDLLPGCIVFCTQLCAASQSNEPLLFVERRHLVQMVARRGLCCDVIQMQTKRWGNIEILCNCWNNSPSWHRSLLQRSNSIIVYACYGGTLANV